MQNNPDRRRKLSGIAVREKTWDLEDLKDRQRVAVQRFETAATAASELEREIENTQGQLTRALNGERSLDLGTIQATRVYITERSSLHKQYVAELRHAAHQASEADVQVRHAALTVRALERVHDRAHREVRQNTVKRLSELDIELWLQSAINAAGEDDD